MRFDRAEEHLSRSALDLFDHLAELHLDRNRTKPPEFLFIVSQSVGGGGFSRLIWNGGDKRGGVEIEHDPSDFQDLLDARLLRRSSGRNAYRLPSEAVAFYEQRIRAAGDSPAAQVEGVVRSLIDDPARFKRDHPEAARHLANAFEMVWVETLDDVAIVNLGGSLRSALNAMAADLVGHDTSPERVAAVLKPWLASNPNVPPRQDELLTAMIRAAVSSSQRLNHLHDERAAGQRDPTREEIRRTAFAVALCCYELDRLATP